MLKKSVQDANVNVSGSQVILNIDNEKVDEIIKNMDEVIKLAEELSEILEESGIDKKVEKKIIFNAGNDSTENVDEITYVNAQIPTEIFKSAKEKGINSIEIRSNVASLKIPPDSVESNQASSISLQVKKLELTDEEKEKFTEEQRRLLEEQNTIYDFNLNVDGKQVSKFNNKITIRIKYELKPGEDKDNITILYLADDGTIKNMSGKYDEETGEVVFSTNHFSRYLIRNLIITFKDIGENYWAKKNIESMASKGIINGKPDGSFDPNGMITRAEFAKMITVTIGIVDENAKCTFNDVSESQWYYKYVVSAANAGIIKGKPNNTFAPDDKITRQEIAVMIYRALGEPTLNLKDLEVLLDYNDWTYISDWATDALAVMIRTEIMKGKPCNIIDPEGYSTRAEAATVIYRFFNYE